MSMHDAEGPSRSHESQAKAAPNQTAAGALLWSLPPLVLAIVLIVQALSQV